MAIFVLSDLHLSTDLSMNKSMDVFGDRWRDYMVKIQKNWNAVVSVFAICIFCKYDNGRQI